ncbi:hypothetical protein SAMN05880574_1293 [Chryseobacterium sp. RU37D]|uniref:tetratricopeptide repeat protein n=1 Tax=Chryseobacterium sp. RU37D TaxID=1907397 RepID=UPI00095415D8|nr:hypothetical protein [Chryseobacterium sp. RU37D]SIQ85355.1 hypothetical protein SAMN05880574_1293 [Chryseobacterium sp. RU37D]
MKKLLIFIKGSITLLAILFSNPIICQDEQLKKIDTLLLKADNFNKTFQDINEFKAAREANILAERVGDDQRKAKSSYYIARSLFNLGLKKESLSYVGKEDSEQYLTNNPIQKALFVELKAYLYRALGLYSQSKEEFRNAFALLNNKNNEEASEIRARIYANLAQNSTNINSRLNYLNLQKKELNKLSESKYYSSFSEHYNYVGNIYLEKNTDSAFYYYQKSYNLKQKYNDPVLFEQYYSFGGYYQEKKEYKKALDFYLKALDNMKKYTSNQAYLSSIYNQIEFIYEQLGNETEKKKYKILKKNIDDKILADQNSNVELALNIILKDKEKQLSEAENIKYLLIIGGIFTLILIFIITYYILRKNLKKKETFITEVQDTLQEKEEIISQKNVEKEQLQTKMEDAYNEVIELAKSNDPAFYFRFQEVYPNFQKKIHEINPGLRTSELILCAYIFLGFNIKDIAGYTFKSVNTIRNRKQNLRKKINLSGEQDIGIWLRNLTA